MNNACYVVDATNVKAKQKCNEMLSFLFDDLIYYYMYTLSNWAKVCKYDSWKLECKKTLFDNTFDPINMKKCCTKKFLFEKYIISSNEL